MSIQLYAHPESDREFSRKVGACAEGARSPRELADRLRADYPNVTVNEGIDDRWYAYRDGHWGDTRS